MRPSEYHPLKRYRKTTKFSSGSLKHKKCLTEKNLKNLQRSKLFQKNPSKFSIFFQFFRAFQARNPHKIKITLKIVSSGRKSSVTV